MLDELGIKDLAAFKTQRQQEAAELERLKKAEEEQKRAQMSEVERLTTDLKTAQEALAAAQQRIAELENAQVAQEQGAIVRRAASKYVDESAVDLAEYHFKQHVRQIEKDDPKQLETMGERDVERWMQKWVEKRPKFAITDTSTRETKTEPKPPIAPAKKPEVRRPIGKPGVTRPAPAPAPIAPGTVNGKDVRPGRANSMNKAELDAHLKSQGLRGWS